jgi:hypothetical protein
MIDRAWWGWATRASALVCLGLAGALLLPAPASAFGGCIVLHCGMIAAVDRYFRGSDW